MRKLFTLFLLGCAAITANAQYQVQNGGFEEWEAVPDFKPMFGPAITGAEEPLHWSSFLTSTGGMKSLGIGGVSLSKEAGSRPGGNGEYCAKINATLVLGAIVAQGNMTTGCINMGSGTAADSGPSASDNIANQKGNYNYTDSENESFNQKFTGLPDAMHVWVKFTGGIEEAPYAKASTLLHTEGYYQDPLPQTNDCSGQLVAAATDLEIASSEEWQELTIPFEYSITDGTRPAYALVSFSTNAIPGKGAGTDVMLIDDLEYLYYSELASLVYDGQDIFVEGQTAFKVVGEYDESLLECTSNGHGATIETSYDDAARMLTITVKGDDWSEDNLNEHVYTVAFLQTPVYQIPNSDFEAEWTSDKEPGNGWNSFASAGGDLAWAASMSPSPEKVEGYNGGNAVLLKSTSILGAKANGNLTTGRINMGSMSPADAANYNFSDIMDPWHCLPFAGTPDSVECYAKFTSGGSENGRGQFILHDEYRYCDPETSNEEGYEAHKIALASILIPECEEWTRFSAPFEYTDTEADEQYMLASFTTNPVPGGSANDELIIDDVRFIYNSELASLTYDGQDIFVPGQANYVVKGLYYEDKLAYTSNRWSSP